MQVFFLYPGLLDFYKNGMFLWCFSACLSCFSFTSELSLGKLLPLLLTSSPISHHTPQPRICQWLWRTKLWQVFLKSAAFRFLSQHLSILLGVSLDLAALPHILWFQITGLFSFIKEGIWLFFISLNCSEVILKKSKRTDIFILPL